MQMEEMHVNRGDGNGEDGNGGDAGVLRLLEIVVGIS